MKTETMKKILIIAAIVSLTTAMNGTRAQEPDAVYKLVKHEWKVNSDGSSDYRYRHEVQIVRNRALTAYADKGETFVVYNPDIEELTVNEVYTVRKDGSRVEMPQNAFIYQLPSECADCGRFNHLRELAMVHTGMEIGCTVVVDYTIHRQFNLVNFTLPLVKECPVEKMEVSVSYPAGQKLTASLYRGLEGLETGKMEEKVSDGSYTLTCTDMQQRYTDAYLPDNLYPTLRVFNGTPSHAPSFDDSDFAGAEQAVGKVIGRGTDREKVAAIRDLVLDNIHLNDIPLSKLGYVHSQPEEVWRTGCGTATDVAVLLAAVLRHEGFVASVTGGEMDQVSVVVDTLEYRLGVRSKQALHPYGEAKDEVARYSENTTIDQPVLDTLEGGFFGMKIAAVQGSPTMKASQLALTRKAPLQTQACDLESTLTYTLPKGMKMVGETGETKQETNVGSIYIGISQSGRKLKVKRKLKLEGGIVSGSDYTAYRELLARWQSVDWLLLRSK